MNQPRLLIVWVYYPAAGHFVEAIAVAANYRAKNRGLKIDIMVIDKTVFQLGDFCDWIENTYAIDIENLILKGNDSKQLEDLKEFYDYVVFPKRLKYTPEDYPKELLECNRYLHNYFKAKIWVGYDGDEANNERAIQQQLYSQFQMTLPHSILADKKMKISGHPVFSVLLKGASRETIWPSFSVWKSILLGIKKEYPNAIFLITGLIKMHMKFENDKDKSQKLLEKFIVSIPGAINCYDVGLENQLAFIQLSDVFISPHTGFAFLAPCVGTPWLALSGARWAEPLISKSPFRYVLPTCNNYPCNNDMKLECKLRLKVNVPVKCMSELRYRVKDILEGINALLDDNYTFEESVTFYDRNATEMRVNKRKLWRINEYKKHKGL